MSAVTALFQKRKPMVMGILNLTAESFASEGRCSTVSDALWHVEELVQDGVDIIDIGAEASNPTLEKLEHNADRELQRLLPVIEAIRGRFDVPLSVDTSQAAVMRASIAAGADMINDIRALRLPGALPAAVELDVPVCLMYMAFPDGNIRLRDVSIPIEIEVERFLRQRLDEVITAGVKPEHIILDPGIGAGSFGKSTQDNLRILRNLPNLKALGFPILVGLSRKTFIGALLNCPEEERVFAGLALNVYAVKQGATMIRTHDVRALTDSLTVLRALEETK